jgi:hypothetical protein
MFFLMSPESEYPSISSAYLDTRLLRDHTSASSPSPQSCIHPPLLRNLALSVGRRLDRLHSVRAYRIQAKSIRESQNKELAGRGETLTSNLRSVGNPISAEGGLGGFQTQSVGE